MLPAPPSCLPPQGIGLLLDGNGAEDVALSADSEEAIVSVDVTMRSAEVEVSMIPTHRGQKVLVNVRTYAIEQV